MKKLILSLIVIFLMGSLLSQKKSNYEKYVQAKEDSISNIESSVSESKPEYDDLYYQPSKDAKKIKKVKRSYTEAMIDTLVKENLDIQVNTYYINDPFYYSNRIGRFYYGGFNYWMYSDPFYYSNNYWMYDNYDWYWEFRFMGYPFWNNYWPYNSFYFVDRYDYWNPWRYNYWNPWRYNYHNYGYNNHGYNNHNGYYGNRDFNHQSNLGYGRKERPSTLSTNNIENHRITPETRKNINTRSESQYSESRRSYTPSYNNPRMSVRPQYNNTHSDVNNRTDVSRRTNTESRTYSVPSVNQRIEQSRVNSQQSNRNYSEPSRGSNNFISNSFNSNSGVSRSGASSSGSSNNSGSSGSRRR